MTALSAKVILSVAVENLQRSTHVEKRGVIPSAAGPALSSA